MIEKLLDFTSLQLFKVFLRIGRMFFPVIMVYRPGDGNIRAMHFALTERDLNTSTREHVENLDNAKVNYATTVENG